VQSAPLLRTLHFQLVPEAVSPTASAVGGKFIIALRKFGAVAVLMIGPALAPLVTLSVKVTSAPGVNGVIPPLSVSATDRLGGAWPASVLNGCCCAGFGGPCLA
jgi:hypothetical protein